MTDRTEGFLLGGRVRYAQPIRGFRSGIEPVLLAAAVPARSGDRVLEGGTGAGAGVLCLAFRVSGVEAIGIEKDPALVAIARHNAAANGFDAVHFLHSPVETIQANAAFSHAFANPPYHPASSTRSPVPSRDGAKFAESEVFAVWAAALAAQLRPRGTLTLIAPSARVPECLAALEAAGCGSGSLFPLWPRAGAAAKLVVVQAIKAGKGPFQVLPGLILHESATEYTRAAEAVLREGEALALRC